MTKTVVMLDSYSLFKPKLYVRTPKMDFVGSHWIDLFVHPDWPETHYIDQTGLKLTEISLSLLLKLRRLKACPTTLGNK